MASTIETLYPERIIPKETEAGILAMHLKRYNFAYPHCAGKRVLDVACGVGYGSHYLAKTASEVTGVEIDPESVAYAKKHYALSNVKFFEMDATKLAFKDASFDVVCSFETIEHIPNIDGYLAEIVRVMTPEGLYIVSTPQVKTTTYKPANPFHVVEFSKADFQALLGKYFNLLDFYGQRRIQSPLHAILQKLDFLNLRTKLVPKAIVKQAAKALGTTPIDEMSFDDLIVSKEKLEKAAEFIVICQAPKKKH